MDCRASGMLDALSYQSQQIVCPSQILVIGRLDCGDSHTLDTNLRTGVHDSDDIFLLAVTISVDGDRHVFYTEVLDDTTQSVLNRRFIVALQGFALNSDPAFRVHIYHDGLGAGVLFFGVISFGRLDFELGFYRVISAP